MMENRWDVIVVGAGGAGLSATIEASLAGARTLLLERAPMVGGSTAMSGGVFYAAGTSVQKQRGIEDSWQEMERYYLTLNQYRVEPALVRMLCQQAAPALEWLIELGVRFPPELLYVSGVDDVARGHAARGQGAEIAMALSREAQRRKVPTWLSSTVVALVHEGDRVAGVRVREARGDEKELRAGAIVLTTGGFGHDPELLRRYYPSAVKWGERTWAISCLGADGLGLRLGIQAGALVTGFDRGLLLITPALEKKLEVDPPPWLIFVNRNGRRFVVETAPYAVMSGVFQAQPGEIAFAIFDENQLRNSRPSHEMQRAIDNGIVTYQWDYEHIQANVQHGKVFCAESLAELAALAGINPAGLAHTVSEYNSFCTAGEDRAFQKESEALIPIAEPPFYAVQMVTSVICLTATGLAIDTSARVLDRAGWPIAGLYAAGEATGGVLGERYIGGGNSLANAITFGRIAGRSAAAAAKS